MTWDVYLKATENKSVRPLLVEALAYLSHPGAALDLGAGAMNDVKFLANNGFQVTAVDSNPDVAKFIEEIPNTSLSICAYDKYDFPIDYFDLVNAQYALPFNPPETFSTMFTRLTVSLKKNGVLTAQFFGKEDGWSSKPQMTFLSEEEIRALLKPYKIHVFREEKKNGKTAAGGEKFWHVFHVIAEKI